MPLRAALTVNTVNTENTVFLFGAPMTTINPAVTLAPEPNQTAVSKPTGYHMTCHGVARQGEDGRPHHHCIGLISLISLMQASRPRNTHTAVAIKLPSLTPTATLRPDPNLTAPRQPAGYTVTSPVNSKNHHVFSEWTKDVHLVVLYCVSDKVNTVKRGVKNEKI